jgi:DNA-binding transcriptional MerR regulator
MSETYNSLEVCRRTGVTYRQLDYWRRNGLFGESRVSGAGSGSREVYTDDDLLTVALVRVVSDALGGNLAIRVLADLVSHARTGERLATASPYVHLVIDVEGLRASLNTEHVA